MRCAGLDRVHFWARRDSEMVASQWSWPHYCRSQRPHSTLSGFTWIVLARFTFRIVAAYDNAPKCLHRLNYRYSAGYCNTTLLDSFCGYMCSHLPCFSGYVLWPFPLDPELNPWRCSFSRKKWFWRRLPRRCCVEARCVQVRGSGECSSWVCFSLKNTDNISLRLVSISGLWLAILQLSNLEPLHSSSPAVIHASWINNRCHITAY